MLLSASRRTDVPAFFHEWFFNRLREGFVLVRNPMNAGQIRRVQLAPELVDCIVFWTKNPDPMIPRLGGLDGYQYYFQFSLTPYGRDAETRLPDKAKIVDTFKRLSDRLGPHRVVWRYDPIFVNARYTVSFHAESFGSTARALRGYTEKATISFMDMYRKTERNMAALAPETLGPEAKLDIAGRLAAAARENSLTMDACAEDIDLSVHGISRAKCIDDRLVARIAGYRIDAKKDKSQRRECGCVAAVDVGAYDTCLHGCLYCYANRGFGAARENAQNHDKSSPLLVGRPGAETCVELGAKSDRQAQGELWG